MKKNKLAYYFIVEFFKNYLSILFAFGLIIWITQAVRLLDLISEDGNSILAYFLHILSILPRILSRISIIIFFISFVVTISKFEDHNELKALWFSGIDKKIFITYLVKFSILLVFLLILIRLFVVPYFSNYSRYLLLNSTVGSIAPLIKYNNFNNPLKKITIYVGKKNQINELEDIILFENNAEKSKTIIAKSGVIINENNKNLLVLINGSVQEEGNNKKIAIIDFDKITLNLSQYSKKTIDYYKFPETSSIELYKKLKNKNDEQFLDIVGELNSRIIIPLFIPSLALLACFLISINKEFINKTILKITIFSYGILIIVAAEILLNLSSKKNIASILLYVTPFFFLITNWFILNYFNKYENSKA
jgi:lipopolysaccharide export system permease protein